MVAILGFSKDQITAAVQAMYAEVAVAPTHPFHFPVAVRAPKRSVIPTPNWTGCRRRRSPPLPASAIRSAPK